MRLSSPCPPSSAVDAVCGAVSPSARSPSESIAASVRRVGDDEVTAVRLQARVVPTGPNKPILRFAPSASTIHVRRARAHSTIRRPGAASRRVRAVRVLDADRAAPLLRSGVAGRQKDADDDGRRRITVRRRASTAGPRAAAASLAFASS